MKQPYMTNYFLHNSKQAGFTLVEMMIASMLGLFIIGGAISVHIANKQAFIVQESTSYTQKNARFLINRFNKYISDAGYSGFFPSYVSSPVTSFLNVTSLNKDLWDITRPILGYDNIVSGVSLFGIDDIVQNTDVLMLKTMTDIITIDTQTTSSITFNGSSSVDADSILIATDINNASTFQIDLVDTSTTPGKTIATFASTSTPLPGNATLPTISNFSSGAEVGKLETRLFMLREGSNQRNALFEGLLKTESGVAPTITLTEMIPNVEDLQFIYGIDTNADNEIDKYSTAASVTTANEWGQVRAVGVALLVSSEASNVALADNAYTFDSSSFSFTYSASGDKRHRKPYITYITLKNI